jgi:hypothetical protein
MALTSVHSLLRKGIAVHLCFLAAAAAALTVSLAPPAAAEIRTLYQASGWKVLGGLNDDGIAVCDLIYSSGRAKFSLVLLKDDFPVLHVQIFNAFEDNDVRRWISVEMRFDNESAWRSNNGIVFVDMSDTVLDFFVGSSVLGDWMNKFEQSSRLTVGLRNNNIRDWHVDLIDPKALGGAMNECVAWAHNAPEPPLDRPCGRTPT